MVRKSTVWQHELINKVDRVQMNAIISQKLYFSVLEYEKNLIMKQAECEEYNSKIFLDMHSMQQIMNV